MSTNVKLNIKIIELGQLLDKILRNMMSNLSQKALLELSVPLAKDVLPKLATKETSSELDKSEGKISGQGAILTNEAGAVRAGKGSTLFILNEDMEHIIKIVDSLEKSGLLFNGVTEIVKHEIKKQEGRFFGAMMAPIPDWLIAPMVSSMINTITGKGEGKEQKGRFLSLLALPIMITSVSGKGGTRGGKGYNNMDHMDKNF